MINFTTLEVKETPSLEEGIKYLATMFQENYPRFEKRWLEPCNTWLAMNGIKHREQIIKLYAEQFKKTKAYTYIQAFKISNASFRALVFSVINVSEMIAHLGHKRLNVTGVELKNKVYNSYTGSFEEQDLTQIYEVHEVDGTKLELTEPLYAIKCWCTSTNEEHWLWVDKFYKDGSEAIASLCKIYKPMLGKIKHIIRQGDVFLFEMEENVEIKETDEIISLSKEEYFKLLKSQS